MPVEGPHACIRAKVSASDSASRHAVRGASNAKAKEFGRDPALSHLAYGLPDPLHGMLRGQPT
jgi:hypothetical protein